jgi:hypothetical protein
LGKLKIGNFRTFYEIINIALQNKAQLDSQAELSGQYIDLILKYYYFSSTGNFARTHSRHPPLSA